MNVPKDNSIWVIDPVHSKIRFDVQYLLITNISGWFTEFEGKIQAKNDEFRDVTAKVAIYTNSLFTANKERDSHLISPDFLNADQFPQITFNSISLKSRGIKRKITGCLTIKGVTQIVVLEVNYNGKAFDNDGNLKAGFDLVFVFNRKDFNLNWNKIYPQNIPMIADKVKITGDIQLLKIP